MKKNKLFVALACLGLLVTGCNKGGSTSNASESTKKPSTSSNPPASQTTQNPQTTTSQQEEPPADDDYYYSLPFEAAAKDSQDKWKKGYESVWTFKVSKNHAKMDFAFAAKMSSSSHGDRSLYTNHENASSNDSFESNEANDGTCRIELKVNGVAQTVTNKTYSEAGLDSSDFVYFRVASFAVTAGEVVVSMKTHSQTGYRLCFGDDARLFYPKADGQDPAFVEPVQAEGYKVTFVAQHCKIYYYEDKDYTVAPKEVTGPVDTRDEDGNICKYVAPDADGNGEVKPQINFKVIPDTGYEVDSSCITISGTKGTEWNDLKAQDTEGVFRITKIKADITVTVVAVDPATLLPGYEVTFVKSHCSIVVYAGKIGEDGTVEDAGPKFYTRDKDAPANYTQVTEKAQFNFKVVPEEGYVFDDGMGEATSVAKANVTFIDGGFKNLKKNANTYEYNITQVSSALTITINCTLAVA